MKLIFWENFKNLGKRQKAYVLLGLTFVIVLLWAFISASIITHNFNRSAIVGKENNQEIDVSGIIISETKEKTKHWEIYGETGSYTSENKVALLNNVVGNFYKENEVSMSFRSSKGTYNEDKNQIILYMDTFIVLKDGTTLNCDKLVWSGSDEDIVATGNIKINRNNEFIATAEKIVISPDYSRFKIFGNTVTKLYDNKDKKEK